jgi:site-specific DNA-methyltransferase (adenine-specific)
LALHLGDCLDVLRTLPDCSVDAVVTDPPYGLSFMGKRWDYDVPTTEVWAECLRVLKPGGHLLAFAGTRTQHRMAVRIEDAGFEIRDMIAWVYGSGFPKSLDVSKAIDRAAGAEREVIGRAMRPDGTTRETVGGRESTPFVANAVDGDAFITAPATPEAQQWDGWGTALKPALEPITMARKPLEGTVAANVLAHGTGGLNVDGCRVGLREARQLNRAGSIGYGGSEPQGIVEDGGMGRWPANLIHDGSDEVVGLFPQVKAGVAVNRNRSSEYIPNEVYGKGWKHSGKDEGYADTGSAARFFYTAKASKDDRDGGNTHPTVKPTDLMRYLCRLVTPPGGVVLDPFMGSGSTGKAAMLEGFGFIGIEREAQYHAIAERRIHQAGAAGHQPDLFTSALAA